MQPLRVIHVSLGLNLGGMEKLLIEFAKLADRTRYELHFVSLTTAGEAGEEIARLGLPVIALNERSGLRTALPFQLRTLFQDLRADIVHTHNTRPMLYAAPGATLAGIRAIVHTRHGQRLGATRRQTFLFNLAARCVNRIVSVSADSTELAITQGLPREQLATIHNGIDLSRLPFREHVPGGPIVFVGRLSPEKDVVSLLRAMAILKERGQTQQLVIAGDGPSRTGLQAITTEMQLDGCVHFLGVERDVRGLLSRASTLVLPSVSEGISLALLEAMATGVPTIATRVGGNPEVIIDGETGLLVPVGDSNAIADAITRIDSDRAWAKRMTVAARTRIESEFDARQMVRQYESLYQSILDKTCQTKRAA